MVKLFLLTLILHLFADYTLQGCLANLKCKAWWGKICHDPVWGSFDAQFKKYKYDYVAGLACHAMYWTLITFAPVIWFSSDLFAASCVVLNTAFHYAVDDFKANRYRINLWQDQLLHLAQIVATLAAFHWLG